MSSISGVTPNLVPTPTTTSVTAPTSTPGTSSTIYLDLGLGSLPLDLTGLTKPSSPADTAALVAEVLALAEQLSDSLKQSDIEAKTNDRRSQLAFLIDNMIALTGVADMIEGAKERIADLKKQRNDADVRVKADGPAVDKARQDIVTYVGATGSGGLLGQQYANANADYVRYGNTIANLNTELNASGTSAKRKQQIRDVDLPEAQRQQVAALSRRDSVYTTANPDYVKYLAAKSVADTKGPAVDAARDAIATIDTDKMPKAQATLNQLVGTYSDTTSLIMTTVVALAADVGGKRVGQDTTDSAARALLDAFTERLQAIAQKAGTLANADWTGRTALVSSDTDVDATPPRLIAAAVGLLLAIRDMLDAILAISKLDTHVDPGLDDQGSGRYRLAI